MLSLALLLQDAGNIVTGSDRARDQGRSPEKFAYLESRGIDLFPQDGSGIADADQIVVASAAVENTVPDMRKTIEVGALRVTRAALLAELFNAAPKSIAIGGTSGKSTTTGMAAWIAHEADLGPTVMNGAVMLNFATEDAPFVSAVSGGGEVFISEVDESDGSIVGFHPSVAVVTNISLDHKSMDELRELFGTFLNQSDTVVLNADDAEAMRLRSGLNKQDVVTFGIENADADFRAMAIEPRPDGIRFELQVAGAQEAMPVTLNVPGRYNVSNALAAIACCAKIGVGPEVAAKALSSFGGIKRRMEVVGTAAGVTVVDDFAHNPDKIAASLDALHEFGGRLLIMFQPHGFGPLKLMKNEFIACFAEHLADEDVLLMPEPVYYGGTADKSVSSDLIAQGISGAGKNATALATREECGMHLLELARPGDRIVIMGARDDTLSDFAAHLLGQLSAAG